MDLVTRTTTAGSQRGDRIINGEGDSWRLPIELNTNSLEPINVCDVGKEVEARHEAAYKLISNSKNVARFGLSSNASKEGSKQFSAPLADPYAVPNEKYVDSVDAWLRVIAEAMLDGLAEPLQPSDPKKDKIAKCLCYLRDRVGVERYDISCSHAISCTSQLGHRSIRLGLIL